MLLLTGLSSLRIKRLSYETIISLLIVIFLYFSYFSSILGLSSGSATKIQTISLVLVVLSSIFYLKKSHLTKISHFLVLYTFVLISYATVIINPTFEFFVEKTIKFFSLFLLCGYIGTFVSNSSFNIRNLTLYLFITSFIFVIFNLFLAQPSSSGTGRMVVGDMNPIWNARLLGVCTLYCAVQILMKKNYRIFYVPLLILSIFLLLRTKSTGPFLAIIISLFVLVRFFILNKTQKVLSFFLSTIMLLIISSYILLNNILRTIDFVDISSGRIPLYSYAINMFLDSPLGSGLGSFEKYISGVFFNIYYPHNIFLESLAEGGIFFTFTLFSIILYSIRRAFKVTKQNFESLAFLFCILIYSLINAMLSGDLTSPKELYLLTFFFLFKSKVVHKYA